MSLTAARKALATFELDFNARVAVMKRQESQALRDAVDREVWALRDSGMSINKICGEYGTKDFNTVKAILARQPVRVTPAEVEKTVTFERKPNTDVYTVTDGVDTFTFEWDSEFHYALMFLGEFDNEHPLVKELRKENNAYTAQIEAI